MDVIDEQEVYTLRHDALIAPPLLLPGEEDESNDEPQLVRGMD